MSPSRGLRVVHYRDSILCAQRYWGQYVPLPLGLGVALWLWAVAGATGSMPRLGVALLVLGGLAHFSWAALLLTNGSWLMIDRHRGWIHWRSRHWHKIHHESFSPRRIETLEIAYQGWALPGLGVWRIQLKLDHPRLSNVRLGWALRLKQARRTARTWAATLGTGWIDERGLLHVAMTAGKSAADTPWRETELPARVPPPPEIRLETSGGRSRFILPNLTGLTSSVGAFLLYALLWCLWAWTSLLVELRVFGPLSDWTASDRITIALLLGGSLAGLAMLGRALALLLGEQVLEKKKQDWMLSRRWLGLSWTARRLEWKRQGRLRRVDPPGEESGLWIPGPRREVHLAHGLSAESLAWLQQLLLGEGKMEEG